MRVKISVVLAIVLLSFDALGAKTSTLSGWVSDESCGAAHTKVDTSASPSVRP